MALSAVPAIAFLIYLKKKMPSFRPVLIVCFIAGTVSETIKIFTANIDRRKVLW